MHRLNCGGDAWRERRGCSEAWTASCSHLAGTVQVLLLLGQLVQRQEGVAVAGGAVAEAVTFPEQTALPDDLSAVGRLLQVLLLLEHLPEEQETMTVIWSPWNDVNHRLTSNSSLSNC